MFRIRYKKATGEIVEWGKSPIISGGEYGIIEEHDDELAQYLVFACFVESGALKVDRTKIEAIKTAKPLSTRILMGRGTE